jgi:hypothetical protein
MMGSIFLMEALVNHEPFMIACGYDPVTGERAKAERMNAEMEKVSPVCCYLGDEIVQGIAERCEE